jgi:hypothetical protein
MRAWQELWRPLADGARSFKTVSAGAHSVWRGAGPRQEEQHDGNFAGLSTPLVADACIRCEVPLRIAPPGIAAVVPGRPLAGRAGRAHPRGS